MMYLEACLKCKRCKEVPRKEGFDDYCVDCWSEIDRMKYENLRAD